MFYLNVRLWPRLCENVNSNQITPQRSLEITVLKPLMPIIHHKKINGGPENAIKNSEAEFSHTLGRKQTQQK